MIQRFLALQFCFDNVLVPVIALFGYFDKFCRFYWRTEL